MGNLSFSAQILTKGYFSEHHARGPARSHIEEKVDGNGLPRLQIYEYGHLGTGNGAAGLELV